MMIGGRFCAVAVAVAFCVTMEQVECTFFLV